MDDYQKIRKSNLDPWGWESYIYNSDYKQGCKRAIKFDKKFKTKIDRKRLKKQFEKNLKKGVYDV